MSHPEPSYAFGPFRMDIGECLLIRGTQPVPLTSKAFEVLSVLLEHHGHLVDKSVLLQRVWRGSFVEEAVLSVNIAAVRRALADRAHQYIETVPKRGYRFRAAVETLNAPAVHTERLSVAVLPLESLSSVPEQQRFADAITDLLLTDLARCSRLQVVSRQSVRKYAGSHKELPQIARELHVDAVVEGTFARAGQRIRVTAQLIDAGTDRHLWAESYERVAQDAFVVQSEVAAAIAREIANQLAAVAGRSASPPTEIERAPRRKGNALPAAKAARASRTVILSEAAPVKPPYTATALATARPSSCRVSKQLSRS